jgi:hypothetical protein
MSAYVGFIQSRAKFRMAAAQYRGFIIEGM